MKLIKFLNSLKLPFLIGTTSLLSGCSLTVPLLVFSGNGEDVYRGSATCYLDGSGTIKFSGTKFDVNWFQAKYRVVAAIRKNSDVTDIEFLEHYEGTKPEEKKTKQPKKNSAKKDKAKPKKKKTRK